MVRYWTRYSICLLLVVFVAGCATAKKVQVRAYIQEKERADQKAEGNAGYLLGEPKEDQANTKKTRKIYVLELTKEADEVQQKVFWPDGIRSTKREGSAMQQAPAEPLKEVKKESVSVPKIDLPNFDEADVKVSSKKSVEDSKAPTSYVEYTIQKEDTLQKISKKFYDSYSKWPRIYEANKNQLKNPDQLKTGTVIRVPVE